MMGLKLNHVSKNGPMQGRRESIRHIYPLHTTVDEYPQNILVVNSFPPGQNDADGIFRCIFVNEKFCIFIKNW